MNKKHELPYIAVIFNSIKTDSTEGYSEMNDNVYEEAKKIDGFLGMESARNPNGLGISVSYWKNMEAVNEWKYNALHQQAKKKGIRDWYKWFNIRICEVKEEREFNKPDTV